MNKKSLKIVLILIIAVMAIGAGFYFLVFPKLLPSTTVTASYNPSFGWRYPIVELPTVGPGDIAYSNIRDPGGISSGLPVRLKIPAIRVDSPIEDALITPDGRMDAPSGTLNVAWFALGPHPGRAGSAVIGGHFGIRDGVPFVFYNLDKLKVGDKVYIEDDKRNTLAFQVRRIQLFDEDDDSTTVFTSDDGLAHLNLIACEGIWNRVNDTYPQRRVVFTDLIPSEGEIVVVPLLPATAILPPTPTQAPIASTTPVPTPANIFSATTRTTNTPTTKTITTASSTAVVTKTSTSAVTLLQTAKNLFLNPLEGFITALLLLGIIFMVFKIVRL